MTKGGLELKQKQADILKALISGDNRGNHTTTGRHGRNVKITLSRSLKSSRCSVKVYQFLKLPKKPDYKDGLLMALIVRGTTLFWREPNMESKATKKEDTGHWVVLDKPIGSCGNCTHNAACIAIKSHITRCTEANYRFRCPIEVYVLNGVDCNE